MINIEAIEVRVKYLEDLVALTKIDRSFSAQTRLDEAKYILAMLKDPDTSPFKPYLEQNCCKNTTK